MITITTDNTGSKLEGRTLFLRSGERSLEGGYLPDVRFQLLGDDDDVIVEGHATNGHLSGHALLSDLRDLQAWGEASLGATILKTHNYEDGWQTY